MTKHGTLDDRDAQGFEPSVELYGDRVLLSVDCPDTAPPGARVLANILSLDRLEHLALLAEGVVARVTRFTDAGGFAPDGDEALVVDGGDNEVRVSMDVLRRLFATAIDHVLEQREQLDSVVDEETWTRLESLGDALAATD